MKCTLLSICLVYFESFSLFIIAIALVESTKVRKVCGASGCLPNKLLKTCLRWMVAVIAKAAALYSASALDKAIGTGTKDAPSTKLPNTYTTNAPVLLDVSTQSCQDESVKSKIGWSSGLNCGCTCLTNE